MTGTPGGVVLVGFMGAGKTAVGKAASRLSGAPFLDLDSAIESGEGATVSEIFRDRGEPAFRDLERKYLREAVSVPGRILATGGGAWLDPGNRRLLRAYGPVIHLEASPETVLKRVGKDDRRPLLRGNDRERRVRDLLALRKSVYEEADITIPTDDRTVAEIAAFVAEVVRRGRGGVR